MRGGQDGGVMAGIFAGIGSSAGGLLKTLKRSGVVAVKEQVAGRRRKLVLVGAAGLKKSDVIGGKAF